MGADRRCFGTWARLCSRSAVAFLLLATACGNGGDDGLTGTTTSLPVAPSTTTSDDPAAVDLSQSCFVTAENLEVEVRYPRDWHVNRETTVSGFTVPPCRVFHHEPFELPRANELIEFDAFAEIDNVAFSTVVDASSPHTDVLHEQRSRVDGHEVLHREVRLTEDGISGPAGARVAYYYVDVPGTRVLILRTHEVGELHYERNATVLGRMAQALRIPDVE